MSYNMFLDDERFPADDGKQWIIVRSVKEAIDTIGMLGLPSFISFDHDLGENQLTGKYLAEAIVDADVSGRMVLPADFDFYVHSQNPVGKLNIESYLNSYLKFKSEQKAYENGG